MDTLQVKDSLIIMKVDLTAAELKIQKSTKVKQVLFKVFYNSQGYLSDEYRKYEPSENEITFFYGLHAKGAQMIFKLGKNMLPVYKKKNFDQMLEIVKLLEHRIFDVESFPGMQAYQSLEALLYYN